MSIEKQIDVFKEAILHLKKNSLHIYPTSAEYPEDEDSEINLSIMPKFEYRYKPQEDALFANVDSFFSVENFENKKLNVTFDTFKGFSYISNFICEKLENNKKKIDDLNLLWDVVKNCTITATIQNIPNIFGGDTVYKLLLFSRTVGLSNTLKILESKNNFLESYLNDDLADQTMLNFYFKKSNFLKNISDEKIEDKIRFLQLIKEKCPTFLVTGKDSNNLLFLTKFLDGSEDALGKISKDFPFLNRYLDNVAVDSVDVKSLDKRGFFDCAFFSYSQLKNITLKQKKAINIDARFDKISVLVNEFKFLQNLGYQKLDIVKTPATDSVVLCLLKGDSFNEKISENFKNFILENVFSETFSQELFNKKLLDLYLKEKLDNKTTLKFNKI